MAICSAHRSTGEPCRAFAVRGARVCIAHGGGAPQVKIAAEERLRSLVHPAISGLEELIRTADSDSVRLSAIRDLLDRTGYRPTEKVQSDIDTVIKIVYEDRPQQLKGMVAPPTNGVAH
jgi:hypothetical protein